MIDFEKVKSRIEANINEMEFLHYDAFLDAIEQSDLFVMHNCIEFRTDLGEWPEVIGE